MAGILQATHLAVIHLKLGIDIYLRRIESAAATLLLTANVLISAVVQSQIQNAPATLLPIVSLDPVLKVLRAVIQPAHTGQYARRILMGVQILRIHTMAVFAFMHVPIANRHVLLGCALHCVITPQLHKKYLVNN